MAEIYVTSTADSGAGSLRQAIADAQDGDVILFDADVFPAGQTTSILLSSRLYLQTSLSIYGGFNDGIGGYTSGATKQYYVYREIDGVKTKVYISDNNPATEGETVLFENVCRVALDGQGTVYHISIAGPAGGCVICGLSLVNGHYGNGGSMTIHGGDKIEDCNFYSCVATGYGGAVYAYNTTAKENNIIDNCSFISCNANNGGALAAATLAITNLFDCVFDNCTATSSGGGMYSRDTSQNTLTDCTISGCNATTNGGGLYSTNTSQNTLNNCTVANCSSSSYGGAIFTTSKNTVALNDCTFEDCVSDGSGGAVYSGYSSTDSVLNLDANNCAFINCSSTANGGGCQFASYAKNSLNACSFINCSGNDGGAITATSRTQNTVNNCNFTSCSANSRGGVLYTADLSQNSFGNCTFDSCSANNGGGFFSTTNAQIELNNCTIKDCSATTNGGGVYAGLTSQNALNNCVINGCTATNGGGLFSINTSQNTLTDCTITDCSATSNGGMIYSTNSSQNTLTDCTINDCSAKNGGGAEIADKSAAVLNNCIVSNCSATNNGGGLFIYNTPHVTLNACVFDVTSSVYFVSSAFITVSGGITVIARINRAAVATSEVITIDDGAALTLTYAATIGAATFTSEGRGYLAVASGIDTSAATLTNVVLCSYGADVSSFAEVDGVLEWEAANPTTTVLIERADGDSWTTVTQTASENLTLYLPPSAVVRLFDGVHFFTAQAPDVRTYYYIGDAEGSFTSAADWSLRRGGVAITEPPVVAGQRFIVGDISSGE